MKLATRNKTLSKMIKELANKKNISNFFVGCQLIKAGMATPRIIYLLVFPQIYSKFNLGDYRRWNYDDVLYYPFRNVKYQTFVVLMF
jgi:hypothetical protein